VFKRMRLLGEKVVMMRGKKRNVYDIVKLTYTYMQEETVYSTRIVAR
jgi:hypothetical protein